LWRMWQRSSFIKEVVGVSNSITAMPSIHTTGVGLSAA
jgi:hypothetical protein